MLGLLIAFVVGAGSGEVIDSFASGFTSRNSISSDGTQITLTYAVGGYSPGEGGLGALAEVVDGVVRGQLESLAKYVDAP